MDRRPRHDNSSGDILVSRFSALGDVAMTLAPLYDACLSNPSRKFILLTRRHPASLFINPPENLILHPIDTSDYKGISGIRRLYNELRAQYRISAYADLHDVLRTKLLRMFFRLGGAKVVKVDKGRIARRRLTRRHCKHLVPLTPMSERYARTLAAAGTPGTGKFTSLFPTPPDPAIFAKASMPKQQGEYWIGIAPFAAHAGKIYPPELMERVIGLLSQHPEVRIFIFGFGENESTRIEAWRDSICGNDGAMRNRIVNMASLRIGLSPELSLIAHCDVMLSMDSANMHLAALAGTRTVSIWGATHPYCGFRTRGVKDEDIIQLDMTCRPCSVFGNRKCMRGDYHCLHGISPQRVVSALLSPKKT